MDGGTRHSGEEAAGRSEKELRTELEEIARLNLEHEKENELLRKALARFDGLPKNRAPFD